MEENLPPGFRFHPTDEELITYYLTSKVSDTAFTSKAIAVVDFNRTEPWDLPGKACMGDKEWYFFSVRDRKYPTGLRTNRATESGYWKTTGKDKEIFRASLLLGLKKTLVFYTGRAPTGQKTNWVMHEYRLHSNHPSPASKEEWAVCRVFQKSISAARKPQDTSSSQLSPESPCDDMINEFGDADLPNFSVANSSTGFTNDNNGNVNTYTNLMSMNWAARLAATATATANDGLGSINIPSLSLPLVNPNLSVNSLLLKALQLKTYEQANHHFATSSYMPHGVPNIGGTDVISNLTSASSSSKVLDCMPQQQQQQAQPFNLDSIW